MIRLSPIGLLSIAALVMSILCATSMTAQQKTPPPPGPIRPLNLPQITEKKLSNGLTVVLAPLPNVPKLTTILTFRGAGAAADRKKHAGIAQISAAVANEGTDTRTSKQIKEELRSIGAHLIVVGDIDPTRTFTEIEKAFGGWKAGSVVAQETLQVPAREKRQIYFVNRPGSIQSAIYVGNITIPRKDKDYFSLRTADTIFGGSFYSRLTRNIREAKGYTYSPFSSANTQAKAGSFVAGAFVRNEVTGPTLLEIFYELDRMRVLPVTDEELNAAKEYSTGNFSVELASQQGLAGRINTIYTYDLSKQFISEFRSRIDALTTADIQKAAAKYFDTYRAAVVIVGDYEKVKDQVTPFGDVTLYDTEGNVISK